jgi:hypothetical protein
MSVVSLGTVRFYSPRSAAPTMVRFHAAKKGQWCPWREVASIQTSRSKHHPIAEQGARANGLLCPSSLVEGLSIVWVA